MGEAKRKNAQLKQKQDALQRRLAAGEFGPDGARYCIVLDKSEAGRGVLLAVRALAPRFPGLAALLAAEPVQVWEASSLFRFVALVGGPGKAEERSFLGADLDRLLGDTLPRALRRAAREGGSVGMVLGVDGDAEAAIQAAIAAAR